MKERSIPDVVAAFQAACATGPDASALRSIRDNIDDPAVKQLTDEITICRQIADQIRTIRSEDRYD